MARRSKRVTTSDMGITNGIDIFEGASGATSIMTANNDNFVRVFDAEVSRCLSCALLLIPAPLFMFHPLLTKLWSASLKVLLPDLSWCWVMVLGCASTSLGKIVVFPEHNVHPTKVMRMSGS